MSNADWSSVRRVLSHCTAGRFRVYYLGLHVTATAILRRKAGCVMDIHVGDTIVTRKQHPCGDNHFLVLRVGMDFRIRCEKCGREVMLPRARIEKNIKTVLRDGAPV